MERGEKKQTRRCFRRIGIMNGKEDRKMFHVKHGGEKKKDKRML